MAVPRMTLRYEQAMTSDVERHEHCNEQLSDVIHAPITRPSNHIRLHVSLFLLFLKFGNARNSNNAWQLVRL